MPELPEVENFKKYIDSTSLHKKIKKCEVKNSRMLKNVTAKKICSNLKNHKFTETVRVGKNLFIKISNKKFLYLHFGMTGNLKYYKNNSDIKNKFVHLKIYFSNNYKLIFICKRKLGKINIISDINEYLSDNEIGIDALSDKLTEQKFIDKFKNKKGKIKSQLMNQKIISGIGNIYADEILFQSGIKPFHKPSELSEKQLKTIYKNMNKVFYKVIHNKNTDNFLLHKRSKNSNCPNCNKKIKTQKISGRTTYYCTNCQK